MEQEIRRETDTQELIVLKTFPGPFEDQLMWHKMCTLDVGEGTRYIGDHGNFLLMSCSFFFHGAEILRTSNLYHAAMTLEAIQFGKLAFLFSSDDVFEVRCHQISSNVTSLGPVYIKFTYSG